MGELSTKTHKTKSKPRHSQRPVGNESGDTDSPKPAEKPVSLRPLEFEEAVRGLLKTKPVKERS